MDETPNGSIELRWMRWLEEQADPRPALQIFSQQYHFFSLHQVVAFSGLFRIVKPTDRESLALLAGVLYEELGSSNACGAHSILFERFAASCGVDVGQLPLPSAKVAPGIRWYVCELHSAFGGSSLPRALATYQFLESSAVETYGPLLQLLLRVGFAENELEFFVLHARVEVEHEKAASMMVERANFSGSDLADFDDQKALLNRAWNAFWQDLWTSCKAAYK